MISSRLEHQNVLEDCVIEKIIRLTTALTYIHPVKCSLFLFSEGTSGVDESTIKYRNATSNLVIPVFSSLAVDNSWRII
jgi:hypothetical protein